MLRLNYGWVFVAWVLMAGGCAEPRVPEESPAASTTGLIQMESADLSVALVGIMEVGSEGTLVRDSSWHEFVLDIENRSAMPLMVRNVKLLNVNGRYVDSASSYEQITAPPDVGTELAGDIAKSAAGVVVGQFVPYSGLIIKVISDAASASTAETEVTAKGVFALRVLKSVELAPSGKMRGSAFLPRITNAKVLVIDYTQGDKVERIEIPLLLKES